MKHKIYKSLIIVLSMTATFFLAGSKTVDAKEKQIKTVKINNVGKSILINKREKVQLKAKVKPKSLKKKVIWKSSNKKIVTVSKKGLMRGRRYGKANVWLKAVDGSKKKAKIRVRVGRKVTSVGFLVKSQEMEVGQKAKIQPVVLPQNATDKKVVYESSNSSIVSVSTQGIVTAKGKGEAVITAKSQDGTRKTGSYVIQTKVSTKSITINGGETDKRLEKGKSFSVSASVQPTNASNKTLSYSSSNPSVAIVSASGVVTGVEEGTAVIRVDAIDGHSTASINVEVYRMEISKQKLIAHRGLSSEAPENSIPAFQKAIDNKFFGVECDIWKTLDGEFMVSHDSNLERMFGYKFDIASLTAEQIKKYYMINGNNIDSYEKLTMPTLTEYLEVMKKDETIHPFIEIKEKLKEDELRKIVNQVKDKGLLQQTYFISMHQSNLLTLKQISGVNKSQLQYVYGAEEANKNTPVSTTVISWCINNEIDLDSRVTLVTASDVYRMQMAGRQVNVWTVNSLEKAFELVNNYHVDMITTEYRLNSEQK
ncbi:MAG: Ig-like domain-containing protein [Eubacterium sp.]